MRLRNHSLIPDAVIHQVLRFVIPPGVRGFELRIRPSRGGRHWHGRAYRRPGACPLVTLAIGAPTHFPAVPFTPRPGRGYLPQPFLANHVEALVFGAAHELRHLWQVRVPRGRRVWGARGQFSERDADAYAIRQLRAWRRARTGLGAGPNPEVFP